MSYYVQEPWYENMGGLAPEQVDAGMLDYDKNQDMGWASPAYDFQVAAEDTVQYESSGGSSYSAMSPGDLDTYEYIYGSPAATIDPNLTSYEGGFDAYGSPASPSATPRSHRVHTQHGSSATIRCDMCNSTFRRRADLKRHRDHIHNASELPSIYCDYPKCGRAVEPFKRKDHFRDHLRSYHREDVEPRGVEVGDDWYDNRNTSKGWWRCGKCLNRIVVKHSGFNCPSCGGAAGQRRQEARCRR